MALTLVEATAVAERLSSELKHADVQVQKAALGTYSISVLVKSDGEIGFDDVFQIAVASGLTAVAKSDFLFDRFDEFLVVEDDYDLWASLREADKQRSRSSVEMRRAS